MMALEEYKTIRIVENILYKEKSSKFIGYGYPVLTELEVKNKLDELQKIHPKATHICYAYRLGIDKNNFRANDDGEPNGTAGKPILGQLDSFEITNCLVVVVRYFGGTKLGISGLIDAYKGTAKQVIEATTILTHRILDYYEIYCSYAQVNTIYRIVQLIKGKIENSILDNNSIFTIAITQDNAATFETFLTEEQIQFKYIERK